MCEICRQSICPASCPNAPDTPSVCECEYCGESIVVGDDYYDFHGKSYHPECLEACAFELLLHDPDIEKRTADEDDIDDGSDEAYERYKDELLFG